MALRAIALAAVFGTAAAAETCGPMDAECFGRNLRALHGELEMLIPLGPDAVCGQYPRIAPALNRNISGLTGAMFTRATQGAEPIPQQYLVVGSSTYVLHGVNVVCSELVKRRGT